MLLGRSSRTWGLVLCLASLLSLLLVLASAREATAAVTAPGSQVWAEKTGRNVAVQCDSAPCSAPLSVSFACSVQNCATLASGYDYRWRASNTNPSTLIAADPEYQGAQRLTSVPAGYLSPRPTTDTGTSKVWPPADPGMPTRYQYVTATSSASGKVFLQAVWDLGPEFGPAAPTTTAAPTTSAAPTSSAAPTTSQPSSSTSAPATTDPPPEPGTSTAPDCSEATPCYVRVVDGVTVDVGSLQVSALTQDQWAKIELALSVLVFCGLASFVASWRHGRGS